MSTSFPPPPYRFPLCLLQPKAPSRAYVGPLGQQFDPWLDFLHTWKTCDPEGPLKRCYTQAVESPLAADHFGKRLALPKWEGLRLFLTVCLLLQEHHGQDPIFISGRAWGEVFGCSHTQIYTYRNWASDNGFLVPHKEAVPRLEAAEYYFRLPG